MPESISHRQPDRVYGECPDPVAERVRDVAEGLAVLLREADVARGVRAEATGADGSRRS